MNGSVEHVCEIGFVSVTHAFHETLGHGSYPTTSVIGCYWVEKSPLIFPGKVSKLDCNMILNTIRQKKELSCVEIPELIVNYTIPGPMTNFLYGRPPGGLWGKFQIFFY